MKRRNLTAAAIAFGACLMIADVSTPSAQLCAAEPQSFSEDILPILKGRCVSCPQLDVASRLACIAGGAHAARQEEAIDLRQKCHSCVDP
jgi:hypothetical protein